MSPLHVAAAAAACQAKAKWSEKLPAAKAAVVTCTQGAKIQ
jgi:hypothetical protein